MGFFIRIYNRYHILLFYHTSTTRAANVIAGRPALKYTVVHKVLVFLNKLLSASNQPGENYS